MSDALVAEHLRVRYRSGALGIQDVSLRVGIGEVVALFGPNGAGKTSTVRAITGFLRTEGHRLVGGSVSIFGRDVTNSEPRVSAAAGVIQVPERNKVFANLTVEENLYAIGKLPPRERRDDVFGRVFSLFPILADRRRQQAGRMSGGQQQMLAFARALMCEPRVLIVDEMTLGLHVSLHDDLHNVVRSVAASGTAVVLVDESTSFALEIASRCTLISAGVVVAEGSAAELRDSDHLAAAYVG